MCLCLAPLTWPGLRRKEVYVWGYVPLPDSRSFADLKRPLRPEAIAFPFLCQNCAARGVTGHGSYASGAPIE